MNNSREEGRGTDGGGENGTENEGKRVSGIWWGSARCGERERMGGNSRKLQKNHRERRGRRCEGRRDRMRKQGNDNKTGIGEDISLGQDGLKE